MGQRMWQTPSAEQECRNCAYMRDLGDGDMWERPIHNGHGRVPGIRRLQILRMPGMEMGIVKKEDKKITHIIR